MCEGISFELPDLNRVDLHSSLIGVWVRPSWVPGAPAVPKCVHTVRVGVAPGLAALAIREVAIRSTDSNVEDQEEVLVERCIDILLVYPRVVTVLPTASLPEGLGGCINIEDDLVRCVDVGLDAVLGPEQAIDMEIV